MSGVIIIAIMMKDSTYASSLDREDSPILQLEDRKTASGYDNGDTAQSETHLTHDRLESAMFPPCTNRDAQRSVQEKGLEGENLARIEISRTKSSFQANSIQTWMSARPQISSLRDMILAVRTNLGRENNNRRQHEHMFQLVATDFISAVELFMATINTDPSPHALRHLHQKLVTYKDSMDTARDRAAPLEELLSNHEYQLQRVEEMAYTHMHNITEPNTRQSSKDKGTFDPEPGEPAVLKRLYLSMGHVGNLLERLYNFEFDLREQLDERDIARRTGEILADTDAQFFEDSRLQREQLERQLETAQAEMQALKLSCHRDGIEFEEPNFPDVLFHTREESSLSRSEPVISRPRALPGSSSTIDAWFSSQDNTKKWVERLPTTSEQQNQDEFLGAPLKITVEPWKRRMSAASEFEWVDSTNARGRPDSTSVSISASLPQWRDPPPGSSLLEALLLESATTPLGHYALRTGPERQQNPFLVCPRPDFAASSVLAESQ
ncbi:hypothetical protein NX059_005598 [Plenodomus lindquistii]|nr:hypothetical protein NX059_005598 [Plenodomus lindquistii]